MRLSINLNKVALLRNQRDLELPDVVEAARTILEAGVDGITVHPRPDGRHTLARDVRALRGVVRDFDAELNVEGNPQPDFLALIDEVRPHQVTLVPDDPSARTSDRGWDMAQHRDFLTETIARLHGIAVRVSLFVDHDSDIASASGLGADAVELYTEPYARDFSADQAGTLLGAYAQAARDAVAVGLQVHAGHDLSLDNLGAFLGAVPELREVSIGHAFSAESLWFGMAETARRYLNLIAQYHD